MYEIIPSCTHWFILSKVTHEENWLINNLSALKNVKFTLLLAGGCLAKYPLPQNLGNRGKLGPKVTLFGYTSFWMYFKFLSMFYEIFCISGFCWVFTNETAGIHCLKISTSVELEPDTVCLCVHVQKTSGRN